MAAINLQEKSKTFFGKQEISSGQIIGQNSIKVGKIASNLGKSHLRIKCDKD